MSRRLWVGCHFFPQNIEQNKTAHRAKIKILSCYVHSNPDILKTTYFFTRIGRFRPNETSESGHRNPTVLKTFSRAVQAPVHTNPDKEKMCGFKNFWIPVDRPNFFLHLSRIAFVHRRWFSLTQLVGNPARLSSRKNYYYWATGSSVRQDMNNVTALKFQALCYWYL